jgi:tetratricopeptide (TPR) repeat protein
MKKAFALPAIIVILYAAIVPLNIALKREFVKPVQEQDVIQRMFGGLRALVADWAFMKAEEYHHKGLPFMDAMKYHGGESFVQEVAAHGEAEAEHKHEHAHAPQGLYSKIYSSVKVTEDAHLKPAEEKEVLPWFFVEVAFDPHDIRGYTLGGYWLQNMKRPDEALKFLKEGEKNNPDAAMIIGSIGWIYFQKNDLQKAAEYLDKASRLWLEGKPPNDVSTTYQRSDRYFAIDRLGSVYEKMGRIDDAMKVYEVLYQLEPTKPLGEKIERLKSEIRNPKLETNSKF